MQHTVYCYLQLDYGVDKGRGTLVYHGTLVTLGIITFFVFSTPKSMTQQSVRPSSFWPRNMVILPHCGMI